MAPHSTPLAHYAHLDGEHGILAQVHNRVFFFRPEARTMADVTTLAAHRCDLLGAVTMADAQALEDTLNGGAAAIALSRQQEVR